MRNLCEFSPFPASFFCCLQNKLSQQSRPRFKIETNFKINSLVYVADTWSRQFLRDFTRRLVKLVLLFCDGGKLLPVILIADKTLETNALDLDSDTFSCCSREASLHTYADISIERWNEFSLILKHVCKSIQAAIFIFLFKLLKTKFLSEAEPNFTSAKQKFVRYLSTICVNSIMREDEEIIFLINS